MDEVTIRDSIGLATRMGVMKSYPQQCSRRLIRLAPRIGGMNHKKIAQEPTAFMRVEQSESMVHPDAECY